MPAPTVTTTDFTEFTGITLAGEDVTRVEVSLERASRNLWLEVDFPLEPTAEDLAIWTDAVSELAWMYWEAEKARVMEILALPVSQLSLGTLFWTKEAVPNQAGMWALNRLLSHFGNVKRLRFVLEDELEYPR